MRLQVIVKIEPIEINQSDVIIGDPRKLQVLSHWNRRDLVRITLGGDEFTVVGEDLIKAVQNATNVDLI